MAFHFVLKERLASMVELGSVSAACEEIGGMAVRLRSMEVPHAELQIAVHDTARRLEEIVGRLRERLRTVEAEDIDIALVPKPEISTQP